MARDWEVKEKTELYEMMKELKLVRFAVKFCVTSGMGTILFYTLYKLHLINYFQKKEDLSDSKIRPLYYSSKFFFNTLSSPLFEFIWISQFITTILTGLVYINYDGFFIISVFHLCGQLRILKLEVQNLVAKSKYQTFSKTIKLIVQRHIQLKRYY